MHCPQCQQEMVDGYSAANAGLSWIEPGVMRRRVFRDKDLADAGLKKYLPWKGYFFRASLCRACRCLLVDFSKQLSRRQLLDAQEPAAVVEPD